MIRYACKNCNTYITKEEYEQNKCQKCGVRGARFFKLELRDDSKIS